MRTYSPDTSVWSTGSRICVMTKSVSGTKSPKSRKPTTRRGTGARKKQRPLGREIWLDTARRALIEEGTAGVEINKPAKRLGVSRGGFYWFFKSREHLLDE